jgi:hypothetical protein
LHDRLLGGDRFGQIDFVHAPGSELGNSVGAGIHAATQDHDLADAVLPGSAQFFVNMALAAQDSAPDARGLFLDQSKQPVSNQPGPAEVEQEFQHAWQELNRHRIVNQALSCGDELFHGNLGDRPKRGACSVFCHR